MNLTFSAMLQNYHFVIVQAIYEMLLMINVLCLQLCNNTASIDIEKMSLAHRNDNALPITGEILHR